MTANNMDYIIAKLKEYFLEIGLEIRSYNDKRFLLFDESINKTVYLDWEQLFIDDNGMDSLLTLSNDKYELDKTVTAISQYGSIKYCNKEQFDLFTNRIESFVDRVNAGFYKSRYAEFFIKINDSKIYEYEEYNNCTADLMFIFNQIRIENVFIKLSQPSNLFKLIFKYLENDSNFKGWQAITTISFNVPDKRYVERYLQQIIFLLNIYYPHLYKLGRCLNYEPYYYEINYDKLGISKDFKEAKFITPLCYFNEAFNSNDEVGFHYYYKIIEHFFTINHKDEIINTICNYKDKEYQLIDRLSLIYRREEDVCLLQLFNNENLKHDILEIFKRYFEEDMLSQNRVGNISIQNMTLKHYADQLYEFRNSIVHGKHDYKYSSRIPNLTKQDPILSGWNKLISILAFRIIKYFCYNDKLDLDNYNSLFNI